MGISLQKGGVVSLDKGLTGTVSMGCGWDPAKSGSGFMSRFLGGGDIDLDASALVFSADGLLLDSVWFSALTSKDGAIRHSGDNLTGEGEGDDETIHVDIGGLNRKVSRIFFTVNSFSGQKFTEVKNVYCRLVNDSTGEEMVRYNLAETGSHTGVIMAELARGNGAWNMQAHGIPASGRTVRDMEPVCRRLMGG